MIDNKKIKKLEKVNKTSTVRFKKSQLKPPRAQTGVISRPSRTYDESDVYMLESDIVFGMKDEEIVVDVSQLNHFKFITSVEIRKDLTEKMVTLLMEQKQNPAPTSWQTLANDFEKSENPLLKEWTETFQSFGGKYESFLKDFEGLKKENNLQKKLFLYKMRQQSAAKRVYMLSTYPSFEMRYRMKKDEVKCTELCFNETMLKEAGYTLENFTSTVLSEGLPQFFTQNSTGAATNLKGIMENFLVNETELPEQETELLMKTGYRKKVVMQTLILVELSETDLILSIIFSMKSKSLPFGSCEKQPYAPEFLEILKSNDKEKEYLFNTYYGENFQGFHSNTEKVCKIREIDDL